MQIANDFYDRWNFPNCVGAIDGKHVHIKCPPKTGSLYFNYKQTFSIVLLALCDANYCFTFVDVGSYGSNNDAGVFNSSSLAKGLEDSSLSLPGSRTLPDSIQSSPHVIVGDEGFPLKMYLLRPYSNNASSGDVKKRIFNYRLSRARRVIENCFGILAARWRLSLKPIEARPKNVAYYVKGALVLHNFLMKTDMSGQYCPPSLVDQENESEFVPGDWRKEISTGITDAGRMGPNRAAKDATGLRNMLCDYFWSEGQVRWQINSANF